MKLASFLGVALGAFGALTSTMAVPRYPSPYIRSIHATQSSGGGRRSCGTSISLEHQRNVERVFNAFKPPPSLFSAPGDDPTEIPVYWHIVAANRTAEGGWLTADQIRSQMVVLNQDYADSGFRFKHIRTKHIISPNWFLNVEGDQDLETEMKDRLRVGGPETLNIYTIHAVGFLGWATMPFDYKDFPDFDGVVVRYDTLPGVGPPPFNEGRTLTHEAGHWCGLYHTFYNGCIGGDEVSDTAPEAEPAFGCPVGRDTCPGGGTDPVHNFMDYSDDSCLTEFTTGQIERMQNQLRAFRNATI